jgi:hypothetical protein
MGLVTTLVGEPPDPLHLRVAGKLEQVLLLVRLLKTDAMQKDAD